MAVVVRALEPWCIRETIHTPHDVRDVLWSRRTLEAHSLETVIVAGQGIKEVWPWDEQQGPLWLTLEGEA